MLRANRARLKSNIRQYGGIWTPAKRASRRPERDSGPLKTRHDGRLKVWILNQVQDDGSGCALRSPGALTGACERRKSPVPRLWRSSSVG